MPTSEDTGRGRHPETGNPETGTDPTTGTNPHANVSEISPGTAPGRQLRRVGVKIGQKVLEFERPVVRLGPLRIYRTATGRLSWRWIRRRG